MNNKGVIIPILSDYLDILQTFPNWLQAIIFLSLLVGVSGFLAWGGPVKAGLNIIIGVIGGALGIEYASWETFVILCFLAFVAIFAMRVRDITKK